MKTMSFYSAKGGVGKSTHTIMFASYLAYVEGAKVVVIDVDFPMMPIDKYRYFDLKEYSDPESDVSLVTSFRGGSFVPYKVMSLNPGDDLAKSNLDLLMHDRLRKFIDSDEGRSYDYVLVDFNASFLRKSVAYRAISSGVLDYVVVPVNTDFMCRKAVYDSCVTFKQLDQRFKLFWNNVFPAELEFPYYLETGEKFLCEPGFEFYPERIKTFKCVTDKNNWMYILRNTLCFPIRHVELACPELIPFYQHVKRDLDSL